MNLKQWFRFYKKIEAQILKHTIPSPINPPSPSIPARLLAGLTRLSLLVPAAGAAGTLASAAQVSELRTRPRFSSSLALSSPVSIFLLIFDPIDKPAPLGWRRQPRSRRSLARAAASPPSFSTYSWRIVTFCRVLGEAVVSLGSRGAFLQRIGRGQSSYRNWLYGPTLSRGYSLSCNKDL
jgi:hypothetical protein